MRIEGKEYRTIWFENDVVKIIDQTKLPHQFIIKELKTIKDSINAIKVMEVRGAPLIGATAAFGTVLAIIENNDQSFLKTSAEDLISSRPTAINLKWAVDRMMNKLSGVNSNKILEIALNEAKDICEEAIKKENISYQRGGTYVVMEGPQFSTLAESKLYRSWKADVIGMTNICLLYTSPSPRDGLLSRMPSSA